MEKKRYEKPQIKSEKVFEQGALGCATSYVKFQDSPDCLAKAIVDVGGCSHSKS